MEVEEWKTIEDYPNYLISNLGNVKNSKGRIRIAHPTHLGYLTVLLSKNGFQKNMSIHRLVAKAFIPNPENKPTVDHKDRNRLNNKVENLRWATRHEQAVNKPKQSKYEFGSMYRGVSWSSDHNKYRARIEKNKKLLFSGYYETELEAGRAYHKKSKEIHGEFYDGQPEYPELDEE